MKKEEDKELSIEQEVTRDCPILFQMRHRPMSETTMCWGFECGEGWHNAIANASRELEMLNTYFYPKYRTRIQADQIKEKFGTLCYYYSVVVDPCAFITSLIHLCEDVYDWFDNYKRFDYALKKVVDVAPYNYDETEIVSKEQYDKDMAGIKCCNVDYEKISDTEYKKTTHLYNYGKQHFEPTKHKIAWFIKEKVRDFKYILMRFPRKDNMHVRNAIQTLDRKTEDIVRKLEHECESTCELCGHQIGTSWSPVCQTTGYIRYICDDCAEKLDRNYIKNNALWHGKECIKKLDDKKGEDYESTED